MQTVEIQFWKLVTPLMSKSAGARWMMRSFYRTTRPLIGVTERVLGVPLDIIFFAIVLFAGSSAFLFGYLIGLWLG